jgi:hypothetical protein
MKIYLQLNILISTLFVGRYIGSWLLVYNNMKKFYIKYILLKFRVKIFDIYLRR